MRLALPYLCAFALVVLAAAPTRGDLVVKPDPSSCAPGTTLRTGPDGPYCQPAPPASCPVGHLARVSRDKAYCEPPPDQPCPRGSYWNSSSATDASCRAHRRCDRHRCGSGTECFETSFCLEERSGSSRVTEIVHGTCQSEADCQAPAQCVKTGRCSPFQEPAATAPAAPSVTTSAASSSSGAASPGAAGSPTPAEPQGCGGCALAPNNQSRGWPLALTALLLLARRRRTQTG